jgi:hypothetical protein
VQRADGGALEQSVEQRVDACHGGFHVVKENICSD